MKLTMMKRMLLAGGVSAIALAGSTAHASDSTPAVIRNLTGGLRIQQEIPCNDPLDLTRPVTQGTIEITPGEGVDVSGGKFFALTRVNLSFEPFSVTRSCLGVDETRSYSEIGVQLGPAVSFTATPAGDGLFNVTIPKEIFLFDEASVVNGTLETGSRHPTEDVTGTIDLTHGTVSMRVVVAQTVHFEGGCVLGHCLVDEDKPGTLTVTLSGDIAFLDSDGDGIADRSDNCKFTFNPTQTPVPTPVVTPPAAVTLTSCLDREIGQATAKDVCDGTAVTITNDQPAVFQPGANVVTWTGVDGLGRSGSATQTVTVADATAPSVFCTVTPAPSAHMFEVVATDACGPTIQLGSFTIANGERIKIDEVGSPGVHFVDDVGPDRIRHFQAGKREAVLKAIDASGNAATAVCR
jgi:hypothetical protein